MASRRVIPERWIIYCLININTGKCYIGVTNHTLEYRWRAHVRASVKGPARGVKDTFLWMAIRKHGPESFEVSVLEAVNTRKEAMETEKDFISVFDSRAPGGYNMTIGGEGTSPRPPISEETREKLRIAHTGLRPSPETREKMSQAARARGARPPRVNWQGRRHTDEARAKISAVQTGKKRGPRTPETKEKLRAAMIMNGHRPSFSGHTHSAETKEKLRQIMIESGRHPTFTGGKHSIDGRINIGKNRKNLPGAHWLPKWQKWQARIIVDKRKVFLGNFDTEEEAHLVYIAALSEIYHHPPDPPAPP